MRRCCMQRYANYMFNAYDVDGDGEISFTDYMLTLSVSERGTTDEKLKWAFSLYDINGDGQVSLNEATEFLTVSRLDIPHYISWCNQLAFINVISQV